MKTLTIVPARGGSKGIPGKNLRPVAGRPLLAHTLDAARRSRFVERLVVSTDDRDIASMAAAHHAEVVHRPASLAGNEASSESALLHALETLEAAGDPAPELVIFLQCTAPLMRPEDVDGTVQALLDHDADSAFAAVSFDHFLWRVDRSGVASSVNHDPSERQRRQERDGDFLEAGSVYVMRTQGFLHHQHRFFGKIVLHPVAASRWVEIDEPVDLELAEVLIHHQRQRDAMHLLPKRPAALLLDFDGVLTDNRVLVMEDGREGVLCHRGDGLGLEMLRPLPLEVAVLSRERNPVVEARCRKLRIPSFQGLKDKLAALDSWLAEAGVDAADVIFLGNDVNDLECMARVGCSVAVGDAVAEVRRAADLVLTAPGGFGAVRELTDLIRKKLGAHP